MMTNEEAIDLMTADPHAADEVTEGLSRVLQRSAIDLQFRARLLTDARGALEELHGRPVPAGITITFVEKRGSATLCCRTRSIQRPSCRMRS